MKKKARILIYLLILSGTVLMGAFIYRGVRLYQMANDLRDYVRYQADDAAAVDAVPASQALSGQYLEGIFGNNPELLGKLKGVVQKGLSDIPSLNLGEVSSMIVTYRRDDSGAGDVKDVVAHVMGGFPLGKLKPGFHRDGYFKGVLDRQLWDMGQTALAFLGRDMVLFSQPAIAQKQQQLIEALFNGNIMPLVSDIQEPLYFTAVFPDPRRLVPRPLRKHIQAIVFKGYLHTDNGFCEMIVLTSGSQSATLTLGAISDLKRLAEVTLRTKFRGVVQTTEWGPQVNPWWAYEFLTASEKATVELHGNVIRVRSRFERVMVNAVLKSVERLGMDLAQMRGSLDERQDPRLVYAALKAGRSEKDLVRADRFYWSPPHVSGPNWPLGAQTNEAPNIYTDKMLIPGYK
ncbi:MAG: hypothetical protein AAF492_06525, partial [Verrucomicrobiota bacterium]